MLRASAEKILFTNLYGSVASNPAVAQRMPCASILDIDGIRILLDCGWTPTFDVEYLELLYPHLSSIDCVLLSSPDIRFCGALPFVRAHLRPGACVIAPRSLSILGTYNVVSAFTAIFPNQEAFSLKGMQRLNADELASPLTYVMRVDDIFNAFRDVRTPYGNCTKIRSAIVEEAAKRAANDINANDFDVDDFSASKPDADDGSTATEVREITAEPIGNHRVLGGHMWRLQYQLDDILYCPDYGMTASALLKQPSRDSTRNTTLLIVGCSAFDASQATAAGLLPLPSSGSNAAAASSSATKQANDEMHGSIYKLIADTLRRERDVFVPTAVAVRGLELLLQIRNLLTENGVTDYRMVVAHYQSHEILDRARTMTELLLDQLVSANSDVFGDVTCCRTAAEVLAVQSPKIVLAEGEELQSNLAAELAESFLTKPNLILINGALRSPPPSLNFAVPGQNATQSLLHSRAVLALQSNAALLEMHGGSASGNMSEFTMEYLRREKLSKLELEAYYAEQEAEVERRVQAVAGGAAKRDVNGDVIGDGDGDTFDDEDAADDVDETIFVSATGGAYAASPPVPAAPAVPDRHQEASKPQLTGWYTPKHVKVTAAVTSKFLSFPSEDRKPVLNVSRDPYGLPLDAEARQHLRRSTLKRQFVDEEGHRDALEEELKRMVNEAQVEANAPSKIVSSRITLGTIAARIARLPALVHEGFADPGAQRHHVLLFPLVRKIVAFRCTPVDHRALIQYCVKEHNTFKAMVPRQQQQQHTASTVALSHHLAAPLVESNVLIAPPGNVANPLQLANIVFSVHLDLDPALHAAVERHLHVVHEASTKGEWKVGLIRGVIASARDDAVGATETAEVPTPAESKKRLRDDGAIVLKLPSSSGSGTDDVSDDRNSNKASDVPHGSVFVGQLALEKLRGELAEKRLRAELPRGQSGMLVLGSSVSAAGFGGGSSALPGGVMGVACIRKSQRGDVTLNGVAGTDMFDFREAIYAKFEQI